MIRSLNFALVLVTGFVCLGLYHVAEAARVAQADLRETETAIVHEKNAMTVLGAEWARITQPARIESLAKLHLDLSDKPAVALSSFAQLPSKTPPLAPESAFHNANDVVPTPGAAPSRPTPAPQPKLIAAAHTGT